MLFSGPVILGALALVSSAIASPLKRSPTDEFHLQTSLADGATDVTKDGLYVYGYHTGAGTADICLTSNVSIASKAFYNSTQTSIQFDYAVEDFPFSLNFDGGANYAHWDPVTIDSIDGYGVTGMMIQTDNTLIWNSTEFSNWLVCDWYHGEPQLFYQISYYAGYIPPSCSAVTLNLVSI